MLERQDLGFEERLAVPKLLDKIQRQMGLFIAYCRTHPLFASRLIRAGLHRPLPPRPTSQQLQLAAVAAEVLAGDHEGLADLLIADEKESEGEIGEVEEVETEDSLPPEEESDKYRLLTVLL